MSDVQDYRKDRLNEINKINELNLPEEAKKSLIRKALKDALQDPKIQKAQTEKKFFRESKTQIKRQENFNKKNNVEKEGGVENNQEQLNNEYLKLEKTLLSEDIYGIDLKEVGAYEGVLSFLEEQKKMNIPLENQIKNMQTIVDAYTKHHCSCIGENYYMFFPGEFSVSLLKADPQHYAEKVSIFSSGFDKIRNTILFSDGLIEKRFDTKDDPFFEKIGPREKQNVKNQLGYVNTNKKFSQSEKNKRILGIKLNGVFDTYHYAQYMSKLAIETPIDQWENKVESINKKLDRFIMEGTLLTEEDFRALLMGKIEKKESKETLTKSLEFEEDTFKIDSKGWKETKRDVYVGESIKVKENATGDVVEYLEGPAKGEQIFITYDAFIREVMKAKNCSKEEVEKKYLMTIDEFKEKMKDKPDGSSEYKKFFNKEVKDHLAGCWLPSHKKFYGIGERSSVWLAGGDDAGFDQNRWDRNLNSRHYGFSGRLLKN